MRVFIPNQACEVARVSRRIERPIDKLSIQTVSDRLGVLTIGPVHTVRQPTNDGAQRLTHRPGEGIHHEGVVHRTENIVHLCVGSGCGSRA